MATVDQAQLADLIARELSETPGQSGFGLAKRLALPGIGERAINEVLLDNERLFRYEQGSGGIRLWYAKRHAPSPQRSAAPRPAVATIGRPVAALELYDWQQRALDAWRLDRWRGVVEAVTGAGKTHVALQAIRDAIDDGLAACVLIPTLELQQQWEGKIRTHLGHDIRVGKLGGGHRQTLASPRLEVLLATPQSGMNHWLLPERRRGLLVADEVHRLGAECWSEALEEGFERRLGLTATYEREDRGVERFLEPYFGGVVYSLDYREALRDSVIAHFRIAFIGVAFTASEQQAYEEQDRWAGRLRQQLVHERGLPPEPFGEFMKAVQRLKNAEERGWSKKASQYLSAFSKRRGILAESRAKLGLVAEMAACVRAAERAILFAQTKQAAAAAVERLASQGISGAVLDSGMDMDERHQVYAGFESGEHELVAAPKLLDEGVDVPSADLAIVLATSVLSCS